MAGMNQLGRFDRLFLEDVGLELRLDGPLSLEEEVGVLSLEWLFL